MSYTLEIKGTKITELNDSDLRNLIGLFVKQIIDIQSYQ